MVRHFSLALLMFLGGSLAAPGAPVVQMRVEGTPALSGTVALRGISAVTFGAADVGTAVSRTVTVTNRGIEPMTLSEIIRTSPGFTVMRRFGTTTLAPGASTTFVVALNSAVAGRLTGTATYSATAGGTTSRIAVPLSGTAFGPLSMRILRTGDPGFRTSGRWATQVAGLSGRVQASVAGRGTATATWTFTGLQPGHYRVAATWPAADNLTGNARFAILNGARPVGTVSVNQRVAPNDFHDAGVSWRLLARDVFLTGTSLAVRVADQPDGAVLADAVRIERIGFPGQIVGIHDRGFRTTGRWLSTTTGTQAVAAGRSRAQATWLIPNLVPGQYRVSAAWQPSRDSATNAAYTILDGTRAITTVELNQRQTPHDLRDAGRMWQDLGGLGSLHTIRGTTLAVRLDAVNANGPIAAGLVRLERIHNPGGATGPEGGTSYEDAVRLLEQSTWGPNDAMISLVQSEGPTQFLFDQIYNTPVSSYPNLPLVPDNVNTGCPDPTTRTICSRDNYSPYPLQLVFFTNAMYGPDQLVQRVSWAWHKIMVASAAENAIRHGSHFGPYLQVFDQNGLGNYRDLLQAVTLNPAMGRYLNMENSTKANPNENYAREVLQLFSIGLNRLNPDGSLVLMNGQPVPTYDQTTITNFAKIFTGWVFARPPQTGITNYRDPMIAHTPEATYHDRTMKTLLRGVTVGANRTTEADLTSALNNIFNDPNCGPFLGKQLIQQLVTSNPSPAYVARITRVFDGTDTGTRGDLAQVIFWILVDPEARGDVKSDPSYGKLREPAQHVNNLLRAFPATSYDQTTYSDGYINPQVIPMGQDVFRPASVFSYFSPFKTIPGTVPPVLAPELQIFDTGTSLAHVNMLNKFVNPNGAADTYGIATGTNAPNGTKLDLSVPLSLAGDPNALLTYLNGLMMHNTMSSDMQNAILPAITAISANNPLRRAKTAVYLIGSSTQYQVQQ